MNLIHIGLPKNGSTSLQNGWKQNKSINYISEELTTLISATRKAVISGQDPNEILDLWPSYSGNKKINIYSSEGLAGLPWGYSASSKEYDYSKYLFANICKDCIPDAKILVLVRSPNKWIRSVYAQMVQEGKNWGFIKFLRMQRNYLISGLNISDLRKHWSEAYGAENVVLYPFERLVTQPQSANEELSLLFDTPAEEELFLVKTKSNSSLSDNNIQFLRAMSIINKRLEGKKNLLTSSFKQLNEDMRQLYRIQLQKEDTKFNLLNKFLPPIKYNVPKSEQAEFRTVIRENFLAELEENEDFYGLLDTYVENTEKFLK
jgi:hypothetical protein